MTLASCKTKKGDSVGAGPQNVFVNPYLMAQYAGQMLSQAHVWPASNKTLWFVVLRSRIQLTLQTIVAQTIVAKGLRTRPILDLELLHQSHNVSCMCCMQSHLALFMPLISCMSGHMCAHRSMLYA